MFVEDSQHSKRVLVRSICYERLKEKIHKTQRAVVGRQRTLPNKWALYLLNQFNTLLQIHAEIDEGPFDTLALVFLLFQDEHVVVEELLQLLVGEVNTELLEAVVLLWYTGGVNHLVCGFYVSPNVCLVVLVDHF